MPAAVWSRLSSFASGKCNLISPTAESSEEPLEKFPYVHRYFPLKNLLIPSREDPSIPPLNPLKPVEEEDLSTGALFCRSHLAWVGGSLFATMKVRLVLEMQSPCQVYLG